jgi:hypothetical protein
VYVILLGHNNNNKYKKNRERIAKILVDGFVEDEDEEFSNDMVGIANDYYDLIGNE